MSLIPKTILKGPVGKQGPIGTTGMPGILPKFSDLDREVIELLEWVKKTYTVRDGYNGKRSWTHDGPFGSIQSDSSETILHHYKKNVKKC